MTEWKPRIGDSVIYEGKTYRFPGHVSGICHDGQVVVQAQNVDGADFGGMKHIYGQGQLKRDLQRADMPWLEDWGFGMPISGGETSNVYKAELDLAKQELRYARKIHERDLRGYVEENVDLMTKLQKAESRVFVLVFVAACLFGANLYQVFRLLP